MSHPTDQLTAHDHDYDSDSSHKSTHLSYSSPSVDLTQHPDGMASRPTDPDNSIRSGLLWPLFAESLPPLEQQYYSDRGRPPGILQPLPNITAMAEYNGAVQAALGLYISAPFLAPSIIGTSYLAAFLARISYLLHFPHRKITPSQGILDNIDCK